MPCRPSAPISGHRSRGKALSRSIASARGAIRSCAKPFTDFRSMSTSGPSPKSKPDHALGIMRCLRSRARTGAVGDFISCSSRCQRLARCRPGHAVLPGLFHQHIDRARRRGLGKEEALHLVAAGKPQQNALVLGFDARDKVLATVVRLLETTLIRVGNEEYARANGSFGLTTLRGRHVDVKGAEVR